MPRRRCSFASCAPRTCPSICPERRLSSASISSASPSPRLRRPRSTRSKVSAVLRTRKSSEHFSRRRSSAPACIMPRMRWTLAVCLSCAVVQPAFAQRYVLRGTIVTPADVVREGSVAVDGSAIARVEASPAPDAIDVDGVIFPGLIDLPNHLTWNLFPRWKPGRLFANRYEWQESPEYAETLAGPNAALNGGFGNPTNSYSCDMNRYGELKAIVNGETSVVGGGLA